MKTPPSEKNKKLADKFIKEMKEQGLTPDQMINVINLARQRFLILKADQRN